MANELAYLEKLDRWLDGEEEGEVPLDVLRAQGLHIPDDDAGMTDAELETKLWEVLEAMGELGLILDFTNHLSDRDLYRWLLSDALRQPTLLGDGFEHISPIEAGSSEEDTDLYLRYYADEETRQEWRDEFDVVLPPKERPPYDRDRKLPGAAQE